MSQVEAGNLVQLVLRSVTVVSVDSYIERVHHFPKTGYRRWSLRELT